MSRKPSRVSHSRVQTTPNVIIADGIDLMTLCTNILHSARMLTPCYYLLISSSEDTF